MPRPLLNAKEQIKTSIVLETKSRTPTGNKALLDHMLRKQRSKRYVEILHQLDAGGKVNNKAQVDQIICKLREEFPDLEISGLKAYVSICYLGAPYEVHMLDLMGNIVEHYKVGSPLPNGLDKVRTLAMHGGYEVIEVYEDCCRAIGRNGQVSVIPL